jgi:hypothetical protein
MLRENILAGWMKLSLRLAALVLFCFNAAVAQTSYTVTDLGTLGGMSDRFESKSRKGGEHEQNHQELPHH